MVWRYKTTLPIARRFQRLSLALANFTSRRTVPLCRAQRGSVRPKVHRWGTSSARIGHSAVSEPTFASRPYVGRSGMSASRSKAVIRSGHATTRGIRESPRPRVSRMKRPHEFLPTRQDEVWPKSSTAETSRLRCSRVPHGRKHSTAALRLGSPATRYPALEAHTLECFRLLAGGPARHKFGKWLRHAVDDLDEWAKYCWRGTTASSVGPRVPPLTEYRF